MMFQLRDEHVRALDSAAVDNFVERACAHLRNTLPSRTKPLDDAQLRQRVTEARERARAYGFTRERSVVRFIETGFLIGPDFDRSGRFPWADPLLHRTDYDQDDRSLVLVMSAHETVKNSG